MNREERILKAAGSGLLLALWLEPDDAKKLALINGEPADNLHVTLCYMGKDVPDDAYAKVVKAVKKAVRSFGPVLGTVGGVGRFNASAGSDGEDVFYASYDAPTLAALRQTCLEAIEDAGVPVKQAHGYSPHITLAYIKPDDDLPKKRLPTTPLSFAELAVTDSNEFTSIPLTGARIEKSLDLDPTQLAAMEIFGYQVVQKEERQVATVKIIKDSADEEQRLVYGVVLEPNSIDSQGHVMTVDDVQYAAHHYLGSQGIMGLRHQNTADAVPVESFIAPCDFELGGQTVLQGSWVLVSYVRDDVLWNAIKDGTYTGYSVGGFGSLTPITQ